MTYGIIQLCQKLTERVFRLQVWQFDDDLLVSFSWEIWKKKNIFLGNKCFKFKGVINTCWRQLLGQTTCRLAFGQTDGFPMTFWGSESPTLKSSSRKTSLWWWKISVFLLPMDTRNHGFLKGISCQIWWFWVSGVVKTDHFPRVETKKSLSHHQDHFVQLQPLPQKAHRLQQYLPEQQKGSSNRNKR